MHTHAAPDHSCQCGLYAYHGLDNLRSDQMHPDRKHSEPWLLGLVRGWGTTMLHPDGWRAEYAEVLALFDDWGPYKPERIRTLAEIYGVPTLSKKGLPTIMYEFGTPVPRDLRPVRND